MTLPAPQGVPVPWETPRHRLCLDAPTHQTEPDGPCRIAVGLEWRGRSFQGTAHALETLQGRVRGSAEATLAAARVAGGGDRLGLTLIGVKAVLDATNRVLEPTLSTIPEAGPEG